MNKDNEQELNNEVEGVENQVEETTPESSNDEKEKATKKGFFGKKTSKEDSLKQQIEQLEEEKNQLNDKFLRLFSEFENYKKRTNKEKLELLTTASEQVLVSLLPVIDNFERANQHNKNATDINAVKEGFDLIYNQLQSLLKRFEMEEIVAIGETFDTDLHEAITQMPAPSPESVDKVMDVVEKGYKLKDKVVRFAKVVIAK